MAKNGTRGGGRKGSVTGRSQFKLPNGRYVKRNATTGQFMDVKSSGGPFKGVAQEPDGRRG